MNIKYNVTGAERKALVGAISEILGQSAVYQGAPTFAYAVVDPSRAGRFTIDKNGTVSHADDNELSQLATALKERGYTAEPEETMATECSDAENAQTADYDGNTLVIEMPLTGFTPEKLGNLNKLVESKATLIKKAIGADDLPIMVVDDKIRFPWFTLSGTFGEADAYTRFVSALCKMAKEQKRVTAKEKDIENDKFTMRLFLIRLGFVGTEYKTARQVLLRNLTGNTAWKSGKRPDKIEDGNAESASDGDVISDSSTGNKVGEL